MSSKVQATERVLETQQLQLHENTQTSLAPLHTTTPKHTQQGASDNHTQAQAGKRQQTLQQASDTYMERLTRLPNIAPSCALIIPV